jgi:hypothetical protein
MMHMDLIGINNLTHGKVLEVLKDREAIAFDTKIGPLIEIYGDHLKTGIRRRMSS